MNFLKIFQSIEELLYEAMSWLVFYPRTLFMTLARPLRTMDYSDREQRDKPEQQYLDTLSPPLFLVLSILLAHLIEMAARLNAPLATSAFGTAIISSDQNLLIFRALMFSLHPLVFATVSLGLRHLRLDRESLRAPFFAQCYLSGATSIAVSVGGIGVRYPDHVATFAGLAIILATTLWYLVVQTRWLMRIDGVAVWKAAFWSVVLFLLSTGLVFGVATLMS